jgi:hypothetical protein
MSTGGKPNIFKYDNGEETKWIIEPIPVFEDGNEIVIQTYDMKNFMSIDLNGTISVKDTIDEECIFYINKVEDSNEFSFDITNIYHYKMKNITVEYEKDYTKIVHNEKYIGISDGNEGEDNSTKFYPKIYKREEIFQSGNKIVMYNKSKAFIHFDDGKIKISNEIKKDIYFKVVVESKVKDENIYSLMDRNSSYLYFNDDVFDHTFKIIKNDKSFLNGYILESTKSKKYIGINNGELSFLDNSTISIKKSYCWLPFIYDEKNVIQNMNGKEKKLNNSKNSQNVSTKSLTQLKSSKNLNNISLKNINPDKKIIEFEKNEIDFQNKFYLISTFTSNQLINNQNKLTKEISKSTLFNIEKISNETFKITNYETNEELFQKFSDYDETIIKKCTTPKNLFSFMIKNSLENKKIITIANNEISIFTDPSKEDIYNSLFNITEYIFEEGAEISILASKGIYLSHDDSNSMNLIQTDSFDSRCIITIHFNEENNMYYFKNLNNEIIKFRDKEGDYGDEHFKIYKNNLNGINNE